MRSGILGGKLNVCFNCVDRHVEAGKGDKVAYHWEGEPEGELRAITYADLQRDVVRFANALKKLGVEEGHAGRDLHGHGPGAAGRDARVHAARRAAHGRLRRLLRRLALRPHGRHGVRGADHAGRGVAARLDGAVEADRRRGDGATRRRSARASCCAAPATRSPMQDGRDHWWHELEEGVVRRSGVVPVRADGQRGPALPHVHERDDREAEGDRAHDRRLPRAASRRRTTTSST